MFYGGMVLGTVIGGCVGVIAIYLFVGPKLTEYQTAITAFIDRYESELHCRTNGSAGRLMLFRLRGAVKQLKKLVNYPLCDAEDPAYCFDCRELECIRRRVG